MKNTGVIKFYYKGCGDEYFIGDFPHYAFGVKIIDGKTVLYTRDIEGYLWQKYSLYKGWEKRGDIDDNVPKEIPFADWLDGVIANSRIFKNDFIPMSRFLPPVNEKVGLRIVDNNGNQRVLADKLILMEDGTYKWENGDYTDCEIEGWGMKDAGKLFNELDEQ